MSKDTYYFSHDYNARTDVKIKKLLTKYGMTGYGIFWSIVEDLYNNANALPTDYDSIAYDLRTDSEVVKSIINDFELFKFSGNQFGSSSVERRIDERNSKSKKARQSALIRWDKCERIPNALQTQYDSNAIKERKGKERKVLVTPTVEEIQTYFKTKGINSTEPEKFFDFYQSKGWMIGKNKMSDWQAAVRNWIKGMKNENHQNKPMNLR